MTHTASEFIGAGIICLVILCFVFCAVMAAYETITDTEKRAKMIDVVRGMLGLGMLVFLAFGLGKLTFLLGVWK